MADTTTDTSRVDEADPKKPFPPNNSGETEVEKLRRENAALKAEIAELKKAKAKEARRTEVTGIVAEAFEHINAPATKDALIERFTESDKSADDIIKEAKAFADELTQAPSATGSVRGLGESRPVETGSTVSESNRTYTTEDIINVLEGA